MFYYYTSTEETRDRFMRRKDIALFLDKEFDLIVNFDDGLSYDIVLNEEKGSIEILINQSHPPIDCEEINNLDEFMDICNKGRNKKSLDFLKKIIILNFYSQA